MHTYILHISWYIDTLSYFCFALFLKYYFNFHQKKFIRVFFYRRTFCKSWPFLWQHCHRITSMHDDVIKWKQFPRYWPFVRGIHRSPVNSPHKGQWRGALMFSLIYARINTSVNNREAGDLRRHPTHCDVIVMWAAHDSKLETTNPLHHIPKETFTMLLERSSS